jgi:mono/diheme cytochrome c family protein
MAKVIRSAGPVGRNKNKIESGLYRKHCVQCHGITGDGFGPAASLLSPYPRDFRRGTFKFKSTPVGSKPLHSDLIRTVSNGIPGTAMPAFSTLNNSKDFSDDVDALAHYVRFLAIRGEVERRIITALDSNALDAETAKQILMRVAGDWMAAESKVISPPNLNPNPNEYGRLESIARGKAIFESELTACVKCHGSKGEGNGTSQDFDDWTKDWTIRAGIDPVHPSEWRAMKKFGALRPVVDKARNLTWGVLRGGESRKDIYLRLVCGIEGSPMPAIARKENGNPGLSESDISDLIEYVLSLSTADRRAEPRKEASHAAIQ